MCALIYAVRRNPIIQTMDQEVETVGSKWQVAGMEKEKKKEKRKEVAFGSQKGGMFIFFLKLKSNILITWNLFIKQDHFIKLCVPLLILLVKVADSIVRNSLWLQPRSGPLLAALLKLRLCHQPI